jgi:hypothetical protein
MGQDRLSGERGNWMAAAGNFIWRGEREMIRLG